MTTDEHAAHLIAIINAQRDGVALQYRELGSDKWVDRPANKQFGFDFQHYEYRIKSQAPKPRELWICFNEEAESDDKFDAVVYKTRQPTIYGRKQIHVREVVTP